MTPLKNLIVAGLALLPSLAIAETQIIRCHASHVVRFSAPPAGPGIPQPSELRLTVLFFSNGDLEHPAVIERLTVRNAFGAVLHDSGPKIGIPHPLNNVDGPVPPAAKDITTVPPGGSFAIATTHTGTPAWGIGPIPGETTFSASGLSMTVEVSKRGKPRLFAVSGRETTRERVFNPVTNTLFLGGDISSNAIRCFRVRDGDDD